MTTGLHFWLARRCVGGSLCLFLGILFSIRGKSNLYRPAIISPFVANSARSLGSHHDPIFQSKQNRLCPLFQLTWAYLTVAEFMQRFQKCSDSSVLFDHPHLTKMVHNSFRTSRSMSMLVFCIILHSKTVVEVGGPEIALVCSSPGLGFPTRSELRGKRFQG